MVDVPRVAQDPEKALMDPEQPLLDAIAELERDEITLEPCPVCKGQWHGLKTPVCPGAWATEEQKVLFRKEAERRATRHSFAAIMWDWYVRRLEELKRVEARRRR